MSQASVIAFAHILTFGTEGLSASPKAYLRNKIYVSFFSSHLMSTPYFEKNTASHLGSQVTGLEVAVFLIAQPFYNLSADGGGSSHICLLICSSSSAMPFPPWHINLHLESCLELTNKCQKTDAAVHTKNILVTMGDLMGSLRKICLALMRIQTIQVFRVLLG